MVTQFFCNSFFIIESNAGDYLYVCFALLCFVFSLCRVSNVLKPISCAKEPFLFSLRGGVFYLLFIRVINRQQVLWFNLMMILGASVAYALCTQSHQFEALMSFYWFIVQFIYPDGATNYTFSICCVSHSNWRKWHCYKKKPTIWCRFADWIKILSVPLNGLTRVIATRGNMKKLVVSLFVFG